MKNHPLVKRQKGVTLIELMVAMALGLILTTGGAFLYTQMKLKIELMQEIQQLQKKTRVALNVLARISTNPGYYGSIYGGYWPMSIRARFDECEYAQYMASDAPSEQPAVFAAQSGIAMEDGLSNNETYGAMPIKLINIVNKLPNWEKISYARDRRGFDLYGQMGWHDRDDNPLYTSCKQFQKRVETSLYSIGVLRGALVIDNNESKGVDVQAGDMGPTPENPGDPQRGANALINAMPILENVVSFDTAVGMADAPDKYNITRYYTLEDFKTGAFANCPYKNRYMRSVKYTITAQTENKKHRITLTRVVPFMNADIRMDASNDTDLTAGGLTCPNWLRQVIP